MDNSAVATKADIEMLMDEIGNLYDANEKWKNELRSDLKEHFDLAVENIRHDLEGANHDDIEILKDRTEDHGQRIRKLEEARFR